MEYSVIIFSVVISGALCGMDLPDLQKYPLHDASCRGDLAKIKELVEKKGVDLNAAIFGGRTALHYAAKAGHTAIVSYLLCHGALNSSATHLGVRPVHLAAQQGYVPILRSLIQYWDKKKNVVDPNVRDKRGFTPIHYAAQHGQLDAIIYLHAWGGRVDSVADQDITPLYLAKAGHHDHVVHYLTLASQTGNQPLRARY